MAVRDVRTLAHRIFVRWCEHQRLHPGRAIKLDDTLSRIFELVPEYEVYRERRHDAERRPSKRPGLFLIQQVADKLETTVGELLGEELRLRDRVSDDERRALRVAVAVLRRLFDLDDPNL